MAQQYVYNSPDDVIDLAEKLLSHSHVDCLSVVLLSYTGQQSRLYMRGKTFLDTYHQSLEDISTAQQDYEQSCEQFTELFERLSQRYQTHVSEIKAQYYNESALDKLRIINYHPSTQRTTLKQACHLYQSMLTEAYQELRPLIQVADKDLSGFINELESAINDCDELNVLRRKWRKADKQSKDLYEKILNWNAHILMKSNLRSKSREEVLRKLRSYAITDA